MAGLRQALSPVIADAEDLEIAITALKDLGVKSTGDLNYVREGDLEDLGISRVLARKTLSARPAGLPKLQATLRLSVAANESDSDDSDSSVLGPPPPALDDSYDSGSDSMPPPPPPAPEGNEGDIGEGDNEQDNDSGNESDVPPPAPEPRPSDISGLPPPPNDQEVADLDEHRKERKESQAKVTTRKREMTFAQKLFATSHMEPLLQGWCQKKQPDGLKRWQRRYLVVTPKRIHYFRRQEDWELHDEEAGSLPLKYVKYVEPAPDQALDRFDIVSSYQDDRTYHLRCESHDVMKWIQAISLAATSARDKDSRRRGKTKAGEVVMPRRRRDSLRGNVKKRQPDGLRRWQNRYFVLDDQSVGGMTISWYKGEDNYQDNDPSKGMMSIEVIEGISIDRKNPRRFFIQCEAHKLGKPGRRYDLAAASAYIAQQWVTRIQEGITQARSDAAIGRVPS